MRRHLLRRHLALAVALAAGGLVAAGSTQAASWIFRPSSYTHDPVTGDRVTQYARPKPAFVRVDPTYEQSAYRHNRSAIRGDGSADRLHIVETWGEGESIRPYGEWLRPYREGATPYGPWGNPNGPWTLPFDSWHNPYGLGRLPYPYWGIPPYFPAPPAAPGAGITPYRPGEDAEQAEPAPAEG
jgi:hypothetical protein